MDNEESRQPAAAAAASAAAAGNSSLSAPPAAGADGGAQVIMCHLDLDCFYAQVEMLRVGCPREVPFVVSQWNNLIAVNYAARACGIGRFDSVETALTKCANLRWEHVATYAPGTEDWAYHPDSHVRKATHKVSLEPYRAASRAIFEVLNSFPGVAVEKGGVDEAFLEITEASKTRRDALLSQSLEEMAVMATGVSRFLDAASTQLSDPESVAAAPIQSDTDDVKRLFYAACLVVHDIRAELKRKTGYEASAGIAKNRTLAKIISATHKPNQQTLLLPGASKTFLYKLPMRKLRGFGGKFGKAICEHFMAETCGELWRLPPNDFEIFTHGDSDEALEVYRRIRGEGNDTSLTERNAPRSLLAQKAFQPPTSDDRVMLGWLLVLAKELVQRMVVVFNEYSIRPYNINLKVGSRGLSSTDVLNKSVEMPWPPDGEQIAAIALHMTKQALLNHPDNTPTKPLRVDCFLLGATVPKPDPSTTVVNGKFVVKQRQSRIEDAFFRASAAAGKPLKQRRAEQSAANVICLSSSSSADDDDESSIALRQSTDRETSLRSNRRNETRAARSAVNEEPVGVVVIDADDDDGNDE
jgi:DNA polymerase eta